MPEIITKNAAVKAHDKFVPKTKMAKKIHALREKMKKSNAKLLSRRMLDKVHEQISKD